MKTLVALKTPLLGLLLLGCTSTIFAGASKPNVIYILADDLGYGEVGYNGQKLIQTPEMDTLASKGMRFTAHYSGNSVCAPSRCSLMTGMHAGHAYIRANSPGYPNGETPLPDGTETVAKLMKRAGYATALIGKWGLGGVVEEVENPVLNSGHPNKQGFDYFFGYLNQGSAHEYYPDHLWRNSDYVKLNNGKEVGNNDYSHDLFAQEALGWITKQKDTPFFLYLAFTIPHTKWQVPDLGQYADKDWPEHCKIQAAMVSRMDRDIGRIARLLEELSIAKNTLIIFNSDNGAHGMGETLKFFNTSGSLRGKKRDMYEGGVRSPMFAYWPGVIAAGSVSDRPSAFWDFLPTMSELTGEPIKGQTDGISMLPELMGKAEQQKKHEYLYWELYEVKTPNCALLYGNWKGVVQDRRKGMNIELYDLSIDESERKNVASQHPEVVNEIRRLMEQAHIPNPFWDIKNSGTGYNVEAACAANGVEPEKSKQKSGKK